MADKRQDEPAGVPSLIGHFDLSVLLAPHLEVHRQQRRVPVVGHKHEVVIAVGAAVAWHVPHLRGRGPCMACMRQGPIVAEGVR